MPDELNEVQPGDLITADFINTLIRRVKELSTGTTGDIQVPNLFARTLSDAMALLVLPGSHLRLGTVLDAAGLVVDTGRTTNANRLIINQVPPPGLRVATNTPVHLVLAAAAGTSPEPLPPPRIDRFEPLNVNIGAQLQLVGENFAVSRADNRVTFDGVDAGTPSAQSTRFSLFVVVPTGIPDAPSEPGEQKTVRVTVTTPQGSASGQVIVLPPLSQPLPRITSFEPTIGELGRDITLVGENFGNNLGAIRVFFDGTPDAGVAPSTAGSTLPTRLRVTIPRTIPGVVQPGSSKIVAITVRVGEQMSPAASLEIFRP